MRRHTSQFDEYEGEIESLDDIIERQDGFRIIGLDKFDDIEYGCVPEDTPPCDFGLGDQYGLCIRAQFGCNIEGCEYATPNE